MSSLSTERLSSLQSLPQSKRLPVLFVGHGSPMNAIEDGAYRRSWQDLGAQFGQRWPMPRLILCISAHWLTAGWRLTAMAQPRTIHDFGGFTQALFEQQYPAPGFVQAAQELSRFLHQPGSAQDLLLDTEWGLDHGAWAVLKPMFPQAQRPVIQLSMDGAQSAAAHFALGQQLQALRERGVLIVASGNVVHNLRAMQANAGPDQSYDWARAFDARVAHCIQSGDLAALQDFQHWSDTGPDMARLAHPSHEHFLPLLYAAGAVHAGESVAFFNTNFQFASIGMRSVVWG